jgi:hypothetical protein
MKAEKYIQTIKLEDGLISRVYHIKKLVKFDTDLILETMSEVIGDDFEALYENGVSYDYSEDWFSLDIDKIIDSFNYYMSDNIDDEDNFVVDRINKCMKFLEPYIGYTIFNTD